MHQVQVFEPTCVFSQVPHENARGFFGMLGPGMDLAHYQNVILASTNLNFPDVMAHDELEALGVAVQTGIFPPSLRTVMIGKSLGKIYEEFKYPLASSVRTGSYILSSFKVPIS